MSTVTVAIILTCFNRRKLTEKCLCSLYNKANGNIYQSVYLVDDGCTDGTSEMLREKFPTVTVLKGDGNFFWNGGMHLAFKQAVKKGFDFYLWINDDVVFDANIVDKLVEFYYVNKSIDETIIVGYTLDSKRERITYGGYKKKKSIIPLKAIQAQPSEKPQKCVTFHGNCVLIPQSVVTRIGINDPYYTHGMGDFDYGYTASRHGCDILMTTFPVGVCDENVIDTYLYKKDLSLIERYKFLVSTKQRPIREWWHFTTKNGGILGVFRFAIGYAKVPILHVWCKYLGKGM